MYKRQILLHLAGQHAGLLPAGPQARARAVGWVFAALNTIEPPILDIFTVRVLEGDKPCLLYTSLWLRWLDERPK